MHQHLAPRVFGCDVCQEVCPWNAMRRRTTSHNLPPIRIARDEARDWEERSDVFKGTAVKRTGYEGLMRNVQAAFKAPGTAEGR